MGHRDDFYIAANIIGITGPVNRLPSVYFKNAKGEYGHITQVHEASFNWGRTEVKTDKGWTITNVCPGNCGWAPHGDGLSHEINGKGEIFHVSRSEFKPIDKLSKDERSVVAEAIYRCPYAKTDPGYEDLRDKEEARIDKLWADSHAPGAGGRRGAIDYTADGLANNLLKVAYPDRA